MDKIAPGKYKGTKSNKKMQRKIPKEQDILFAS